MAGLISDIAVTLTSPTNTIWQEVEHELGGVHTSYRWRAIFATTGDPDSSSDVTFFFAVGSVWINTSAGRYWVALDVSDGAAVWQRLQPYDADLATLAASISANGLSLVTAANYAAMKALLAYAGTEVSNTPAGTIAATDVQAAINELDTEKVAKAGDTMTGTLNIAFGSGLRTGGNVTYNTVNPSSQLVGGATAAESTFAVARFASSAASGPNLDFIRSRTNTIGNNVAVQSGNRIGTLASWGADGTDFPHVAAIHFLVSAAVSTGIVPGAVVFLTSDTSGTRVERGRFDHLGNFQMGSSPTTVIDDSRLFRTRAYTVATLPAAGTAGRHAHVTDALAPAYNVAVAGGGAVTVGVFDNGAAWVCA